MAGRAIARAARQRPEGTLQAGARGQARARGQADDGDDRGRRARDRDGKDAEDEGDRLGTITSYDAQTRTLLVSTLAGATLTVRVDEATEVEFEDTDEDGTLADLRAGLVVAELEIDDDTGFVEEIELYAA